MDKMVEKGNGGDTSSGLHDVGELENHARSFGGFFRRLLTRNRFYLLGGVLVAVLVPLVLRFGIDGLPLNSSSLSNTAVGSFFAIVIGFFFFRRLIDFPGTEGISYSVPIFAATYGFILIFFLFLRLDYSRYLFGTSYVLAVIWFTGMSLVMRRTRTYRIGIVPGGCVDHLSRFPSIAWYSIAQPNLFLPGLNAIVADLRHDFSPEWERFIAESAVSGTPVFDVKHLKETLTGKVEIEHLSENSLGALNPDDLYLKLKQTLDWLVALVALLCLLPVFLCITILVRLDSKGPAIFRQKRMGYRGKVFIVYKFRTMKLNSRINEENERDLSITKDRDYRITKLGQFLRKTRLDELPQILNILRGEMSWIGPRPEALPLSDWYEKELPFYRYRHIVRPGISGWAQVMQGHVASPNEVREKLHYDFYYIKNFSPWLDLLIILKTMRTMLTGFGAR